MALELQKYVEGLLTQEDAAASDKSFLQGVLAITRAYLDRAGGLLIVKAQSGENDLDLSKIPYDADEEDSDLLVGFIRQLNASTRARGALVRYVRPLPWNSDPEGVKIRTIRDLYLHAQYGGLKFVPELGKKSQVEILNGLEEARTVGGILPLTRDEARLRETEKR